RQQSHSVSNHLDPRLEMQMHILWNTQTDEALPNAAGLRWVMIPGEQMPHEILLSPQPFDRLPKVAIRQVGRIEDVTRDKDVLRACTPRHAGDPADGLEPRFPKQRNLVSWKASEWLPDLPIGRVNKCETHAAIMFLFCSHRKRLFSRPCG